MDARSITDSSKPTGHQQDDFLREKYAHDRAHELELNRFTHAFELEQIRLLFLLNGGAFTVLVALVEWRPIVGSLALLLMAAALAWLLGLLAAVVAGRRALDVQRAFTQAYHNRRRSVETGLLAPDEIDRKAHYEARADAFVEAGITLSQGLKPRVYACVGLFMVGGLAAALYLMVVVPGASVAPTPSTGNSLN
jgi:hypothetical protein